MMDTPLLINEFEFEYGHAHAAKVVVRWTLMSMPVTGGGMVHTFQPNMDMFATGEGMVPTLQPRMAMTAIPLVKDMTSPC